MKTKSKTILITAISTLAVGLFLGWIFFGSSEKKQENEHSHTTEVNDETIWTCSMHPQIRQNEPGDCPICGMDLIPLASEEGETDTMVLNMSPTAMQLANVSTAIVGTMEPVKIVRLNGKVQEDERLVSSQTSHIPGRIERLAVNFTGEYIKAGQTIAYIYSPELVTAQEELFQAYKIRDNQPQLYNAAREKLKNWKLSENQIDQIIQSGNKREEFPVSADISGYVIQKMVNPGDYVQRGQAIFQIADLSKVWVLFDVYESDMPWINIGDNVNFTLASLPGEEFHAKISFIDPVIDPLTRIASARVEVSNRDLKLKPEMFVSGTVEADLDMADDAVVIPKSAVMWTGERSVVYVKAESKTGLSFIMREVVLGPALGESFIVESGLEEGEEIAIHGTFSIDAAAQLAGKPSMMNREGASAMSGHKHGGKNPANASAQKADIHTVVISKDAKDALKPLLQDYMLIKDGLVDDNFEESKKAAKDFKDDLSKINMSLFDGESHALWMEYNTHLKQQIQQIINSQTIDEARKAFIAFSDQMILLVETFRPMDNDVYLQTCPMANNSKGADWLSASKEVRNPYFGEAMLDCGEVIKEIRR